MRIPPEIQQVTARDFIAALGRDGFKLDRSGGKHKIFVRKSDNRRVTVMHTHPGDTFRLKTLRGMLIDAGWASLENNSVDEEALRRVKLL